jgi:galactokinase
MTHSEGRRRKRTGTAIFRDAFGMAPVVGASAPGRVNLLGEHTDYNGGPVLPIALDRRTTVHAAPSSSFQFRSAIDPGIIERRLDDPPSGHWTDYLVGVARELVTLGAKLPGALVSVESTVPVGAGLSSSAALAVSAAAALSRLAGRRVVRGEIAEIAWRAETGYVGVRCGRMDQTASAFAHEGEAMAFDAGSGSIEYVPFPGSIWLVDSGLRHALVSGEYEHRRIECEEALRRCRRLLPGLGSLAAIPPASLVRLKRDLPHTLWRRVRHVVTETARVQQAVIAMRRGRTRELGALLLAGHASLRRDFESSCAEADAIVELARRAGASGARLTGAGWGGAVVVLAPRRTGRLVVDRIQAAFARRFHRVPEAWSAHAGAGVRVGAMRASS